MSSALVHLPRDTRVTRCGEGRSPPRPGGGGRAMRLPARCATHEGQPGKGARMRRMPSSRGVCLVALSWVGLTASAAESCYVEERRLVAVPDDGRYAEYLRTDTLDTARIYSLVEIRTGRQVREFG